MSDFPPNFMSSFCLILGRITFTEPNIQSVPRDFEIRMPTLVGESPPSQALGKGLLPMRR